MADEYTIEQDYSVVSMPSKTFKIDWDHGHINGTIDGLESLKQAIQLSLLVSRYDWAIYSWQYGNELLNCIGEPNQYVQSESKRMIVDALSNDNRILSIDDFEFTYPDKESIKVSFTVQTIYGETSEEVTI